MPEQPEQKQETVREACDRLRDVARNIMTIVADFTNDPRRVLCDLADRIEAAAERELSRAADDAASKATLDRTAKDAAEYMAYAMAHNPAPQGPASAAPAAAAPEPLDAILAEMREAAKSTDLFNGEEVGEPLIRGTKVEDWADRIKAAWRELSKNGPNNGPEIGQFAPKPDWGVHEALAFANTLANHGWTREANPDAASSCIYALCRILSSPGNAAALREALMKAKLYFDHRGEGTNLDDAGMVIDAITSIYAALAAPARNCDRFKTAVGAMEEWEKYPQSRYKGCRVCPHGDASMVSPSHLTLAEWLFAPAKGGDAK